MLTAGAAFRGYATKQAAPGGAVGIRGTPSDSVADGQRIFRFDTFGDEQFWTDTLHMNQVVERSVDPTTALAVGLKVDADVLPPGILQKVDLKSPATTAALLKMNAVEVGAGLVQFTLYGALPGWVHRARGLQKG